MAFRKMIFQAAASLLAVKTGAQLPWLAGYGLTREAERMLPRFAQGIKLASQKAIVPPRLTGFGSYLDVFYFGGL